MATVLSTKKLQKNQKELLLNSGIGLVEYDAIKINFTTFQIPSQPVENAIISSKNSLRAILQKEVQIKKYFCVGDKTAKLCKEAGFKVSETGQNSEELAKIIIGSYSQESFIFFCGNKRRDELPSILGKNSISLEEIEVYETDLIEHEIQGNFDGILFFSPSAVKSYISRNIVDMPAFCIGKTTATEAKKYFKEVITANKPGIENVIAKAVTYFKN